MSDDHHGHGPKFDYQPALPIPNGKAFMWLFLSTEIMFFAGLDRHLHRAAIRCDFLAFDA